MMNKSPTVLIPCGIKSPTEELQLLIIQLTLLNEMFKQNILNNKCFDEVKAIYLRIKETNSNLKKYWGQVSAGLLKSIPPII